MRKKWKERKSYFVLSNIAQNKSLGISDRKDKGAMQSIQYFECVFFLPAIQN